MELSSDNDFTHVTQPNVTDAAADDIAVLTTASGYQQLQDTTVDSTQNDVGAGHDSNRPTLGGSIITTLATIRQPDTDAAYAEIEHAPYDDVGREYNAAVDQVGVSDCLVGCPTVVSCLRLRLALLLE